mmetsp:Transcript_2465/g.6335  ORF Transcript_2465/g.6335 Transcript_2465/m.6335 type:complete len:107 (+) Transcript_2465:200-520(+)
MPGCGETARICIGMAAGAVGIIGLGTPGCTYAFVRVGSGEAGKWPRIGEVEVDLPDTVRLPACCIACAAAWGVDGCGEGIGERREEERGAWLYMGTDEDAGWCPSE